MAHVCDTLFSESFNHHMHEIMVRFSIAQTLGTVVAGRIGTSVGTPVAVKQRAAEE